ncbi:PTS system N-acetylmuramic acid transporter subunits EIIBC [Salmonella enterica subsp. arizonae]|uniref:PTS system N-acetylmuramic acid transporter subunits EIIBC n=1 Tax=Salmonella enterica subsp. arizonae TaxID=59203 RepID=A0A379T8G0_SALER|nr:PTS system N-acetylmuramic acid transporter subunits EIIBC [Salmonella enterica subsp. arizonae]
MTRLRLSVHDSTQVDPAIRTLEGVKGVVLSDNQVQVIFWPRKSPAGGRRNECAVGQ